MSLEVYEGPQGDDAWRQVRSGVVTASRFADILAKGEGKTRRKYMYELASEIITQEYAPGWEGNVHTERGKAMEEEARDCYVLQTGCELKQVGFIRNGRIGCSPDSLIVGQSAALEAKTKLPHLQIEALMKGTLPSEHVAQVQGTMLVCDFDWMGFISYWPKLPPLILKVIRDDAYIANLQSEINRFHDELDQLVEKLRGM